MLDGILDGAPDVSQHLGVLLDEHQHRWQGRANYFYADSGSSAGKFLNRIELGEFSRWSVSYNKWTDKLDRLVLLCYVESEKTSSNFRPQQWQKPIHRSNHGRIRLSVCSHVTPEVFFGAQVDDCDEQIRQDGQDQVVMKPAPTAPLEVIQTQIGLSPLEILFNVPAGTAPAYHSRLFWRSVQMRQVIMIRFGIARGPIDDQPEFFQIGRSPIQGSRQINLHPRQARP